jgi:hypothetical protein
MLYFDPMFTLSHLAVKLVPFLMEKFLSFLSFAVENIYYKVGLPHLLYLFIYYKLRIHFI